MSNRLAHEKSPYLLQHRDNPVDWYPWGEEAFELARSRDCPIFLSIGYSTCHWCHVMERESFCDHEIARLLNEHYVAIKVDREERPDLDHIYMEACRFLTGRGGWPLSIIMTPEQEPFFAATYIPRSSEDGEMGMLELLPRVATLWAKDRKALTFVMEELKGALQKHESGYTPTRKDILKRAFHELQSRYDFLCGGFDVEPKFPVAHNLLFLLKYFAQSGELDALDMAEATLQSMRLGGIFDHVGYGFHRYSTDRQWRFPHFEKMLYDQAAISTAYCEAAHLTGNLFYRQTVDEIYAYVDARLTSPEGAFYCAEDADIGSKEGGYYLFTSERLQEILTPGEYEFLTRYFQIQPEGNFPTQPGEMQSKDNILYMDNGKEPALEEKGPILGSVIVAHPEFQEMWQPIRKKLLYERLTREQPPCDDKILTDINGMMISSYARAGFLFDSMEYTRRAERAVDFILNHMENKNRLYHRYRENESAIEGMLDDYIFLSDALLELYHSTGRIDRLSKAIGLMETVCDEFFDEQGLGFFLTSAKSNPLITRPKNYDEGAVVSGNSAALSNLLRLYHITGNPRWKRFAEELIRGLSPYTEKFPGYYSAFMSNLYQLFGQSREIVLVYPHKRGEIDTMLRMLRQSSLGDFNLLQKKEGSHELDSIAPFTKEMKAIGGRVTAYICLNQCCEMPINNPDEFARRLAV